MDTKKKIAMVVQRYGLEVNGGAELECRLYAERLIPFFDVTVITTCAIDHYSWSNEYPTGESVINGVRVLRFPTDQVRDMPIFSKIHARILGASHTRDDEVEWMKEQGPVSTKLIEYIRISKNEYSAFVFMTYLYYQTFYGLPVVGAKSVLIPTAHDEPPIYLSVFKDVFTQPKAIFYNTLSEQLFVHQLFKNNNIRSEIGGAGVDLPTKIDTTDFRTRFNLKNPYMVYVGRIEEGKGCHELFELLDRYNIRRQKNGVKPFDLVMVGKPAMKIPERKYIHSLGFVSENDKYAAIKESEFLVLPSHFESLSIVVLEAFRLAKAVLVNGNCEVLRDHCTNSNGGLYYKTPDEFNAYIDYLLAHSEVRLQMGKNGQVYQKKYYSWDNIIAKLCGLINYAAK